MNTCNDNFAVRVLAIAVQGALAGICAAPMVAHAEDDAAALKRPDNFVEVGVSGVSTSSAKFGEYNGLDKKGAGLIGNFSVRGGNAYDGSGATRFEFTGKDFGTTSREFGVGIGEQGRWNLNFGYDELQHNLSNTYQTPYLEKMGGNRFTLPANFGYIDTTRTTLTPTGNGLVPAAAWVAGTRNMTAAQQSAFHTEEISSTRKNMSFAAGLDLTRQWSVQFDFNRLEQDGAKLQSFATSGYSAVTAPTAVPAATATWKNQGSIMVPAPTNYQTNTVNLALSWKGDQGHATGSYYGSFFHDAYNGYTAMNPMAGAATGTTSLTASCGAGVACYSTNQIGTAPTNTLHQLNLSGGYAFSDTTKLAGGISRGRNTQDATFMSEPAAFSNPFGASLNGLVVTTNANLKLTNQSIKNLALTAGYKYNERDNQTASSVIGFYDIRATKAITDTNGTSATNRWNISTIPFSNKKQQLELAADYRFGKGQSVRAGYEHEKVDRWCNQVAPPSTTAACRVVDSSSEDKLALGYKQRVGERVSFGVGYAYADRRADYDPLGAAYGDRTGFRPYFEASREQNLLKANVNWRASDQLSLSANAKYSKEKYPDSTLGDQDGETRGINLDATYGYSDTGSLSAYITWQDKERNGRLSNNGSTGGATTVAPTSFWFNRQNDVDNTLGINVKQKGLMGGKLALSGDLSYSHDVTHARVDDAGYNTVARTALTNCFLSNVALCGSLPDVTNKLIQLKLTGDYLVDKQSKVTVYYLYQKLTSTDWYYNGYQYGYTANAQLPTNEQSPSYSVSVIGVSYNYSFK